MGLVIGIVVIVLVVVSLAAWFVIHRLRAEMERRREQYRIAAKADVNHFLFVMAAHHAPVLEALGGPIHPRCCAEIRLGKEVTAEIPIEGPEGTGRLVASLHQDDGWILDNFALVSESRPQVDLLPQHNPVALSELHGVGQIYLVPVGTQVVPVERFVQHYKQKFGLDLKVLPAMPMPKEAYDSTREQYVAEDVIGAMRKAHWDLANEPQTYLMGVTHDDIFIRNEDWRFTTSLRVGERSALVSTARMYERFWKPNPFQPRGLPLTAAEVDEAEAKAEQMLTKDIARQYWHLPLNQDPQSELITILTPTGRSDDIWRSDLFGEETIYGRDVECLLASYDYGHHWLRRSSLTTCGGTIRPGVDEEIVAVKTKNGRLLDLAGDFALAAPVPIEFQRVWVSGSTIDLGSGIGIYPNYDSWITADDVRTLTAMQVYNIDDGMYSMVRITPWRWFHLARFQGQKRHSELFGAIGRVDDQRFKITLANGEAHWYLSATSDQVSFLDEIQGRDGASLKLERDASRKLVKVSSGKAEVRLDRDAGGRVIRAQASDGTWKKYAYDNEGCLARIERPGGAVTTYAHTHDCRLTGITVQDHGKSIPLLRADYDNDRLMTLSLDGETYRFQYRGTGKDTACIAITLPDGRILDVVHEGMNDTGYLRPAPK